VPKASIIIPAYNAERFISQAVDSALSQTYPDFEVIVVDDGSTDGTRAVLSAYGDKIHYIYQENKGPSAARNAGFLASQGDYLLFLDSDDLIAPNKLELQVSLLEAQPDFGLVYSGWDYINEDGTQILHEMRPQKQGRLLKDLLRRTLYFNPSAAVIRRECLVRAGLFDESLRAAEDIDLWTRIARAGYTFGYIDQLLLLYRVHHGSLFTHISNQARNEFARLNKFFADPGLPADIKALEAEAYSIVHYEIAARYYRAGEIKLGQDHLCQAIAICPTLSTDEEWLLGWLTFFALNSWTDDPQQFMDLIFDNLPAAATTLGSLRRRAYGRYHIAAVFSKYQKSQPKEIRQHILPALLGDPAIIRNRGFISISLRSLFG
jgi:glycosyltransferase involved in cell wall biosynthesis